MGRFANGGVAGKEILVDPAPFLDENVVRLIILGTGFGLLLRQRGKAALHASSVCINDKVVAFVGTTGCGKSSLALASVERGNKLVADDVTALDLNEHILSLSGKCNAT